MRVLLGFLIAVTLSACGQKYLEQVKLTPICPRVAILGDTERLTQFVSGPSQDLTDIAFDARLSQPVGSCQFDEGKQKVTLTIDVPFSAARGPAYRGPTKISYFVATLDDARNVMGREQFDLLVNIPKDQTRVDATEQLTESYTIKKESLGAAYQVLVGFVLSPEQLAYNRSQR
jgi:hypothetical protein